MGAGRPPVGCELVERLEASDHAKRRLKLILQTLAGQKPVVEACRELGISQQAFFQRRRQWLQQALADLEPRPAGRPPRPVDERDAQIQSLRQRVGELEARLHAAGVREQIALTMPELLTGSKLGGSRASKKRPIRPSRRRR